MVPISTLMPVAPAFHPMRGTTSPTLPPIQRQEITGLGPDRNDDVSMKWNDAWLSNMDCDGDGKLDRHLGFTTYIGSGAWETNHQSGSYVGDDGKEYHWSYFVKIVAVPADADKVSGIWYAANGAEIGPDIWGEFAVIQEVYNDTGTGDHGILYRSPAAPGLGKYK